LQIGILAQAFWLNERDRFKQSPGYALSGLLIRAQL